MFSSDDEKFLISADVPGIESPHTSTDLTNQNVNDASGSTAGPESIARLRSKTDS